MATIVRSHRILVNAPLRDAFDYVSDLTRHPEWSGGQLKIEAVTSGPVKIGSEYFSNGEVANQKERPNRIRVSCYEPPRRFSFIANDPLFGDVTHEFKLTEVQGGIQIERIMTLSLNIWMAFAFRFFIYPVLGKPSMDRSMLLLQKRLERSFALVL